MTLRTIQAARRALKVHPQRCARSSVPAEQSLSAATKGHPLAVRPCLAHGHALSASPHDRREGVFTQPLRGVTRRRAAASARRATPGTRRGGWRRAASSRMRGSCLWRSGLATCTSGSTSATSGPASAPRASSFISASPLIPRTRRRHDDRGRLGHGGMGQRRLDFD